MAATPVVSTIDVLEEGSAQFTCTLVDEAGAAVTLSALDTITLTLYDDESDDIINSRDAQSVKNTNGGTFHATSGLFTMQFAAADNPIVGSPETGEKETHYALFQATWDSGSGSLPFIVKIRVRQLHRVS